MQSTISFEIGENPVQSTYNFQRSVLDFCMGMLEFYDKQMKEQKKLLTPEKIKEDNVNTFEEFLESFSDYYKCKASIKIWSVLANVHKAMFFALHTQDEELIASMIDNASEVARKALELIEKQQREKAN